MSGARGSRGRFLPAAALLVALAGVAGASGGCQSFAKLAADDPTVCAEEVQAAGEARHEPALLPHIRHILWNNADYRNEVVVAAMFAVAHRGDRSSVAAIARLARTSDDEEIRWHAALALKQLGGARADRARAQLAREDASGLVRGAARWGVRPAR